MTEWIMTEWNYYDFNVWITVILSMVYVLTHNNVQFPSNSFLNIDVMDSPCLSNRVLHSNFYLFHCKLYSVDNQCLIPRIHAGALICMCSNNFCSPRGIFHWSHISFSHTDTCEVHISFSLGIHLKNYILPECYWIH